MPRSNQALPAGSRLKYLTDAAPGIRRRRRGRGFTYQDPEGRRIEDPEALMRINELTIPPAWEDVWISPTGLSHLQVTGRDARGRKQYLYHPRWREIRDEAKFARLIEFGENLPRLRRAVRRRLREKRLCRDKALAVAVALLEGLHVRVGGDAYMKDNGSVGLATLRKEHVDVRGEMVHFEFRGKSGRECSLDFRSPRIARIIRKCVELPGQRLFHYTTGEGEIEEIDSGDVNNFLHEHLGEGFTAKDFRTWSGSVLANALLLDAEQPTSEAKRKRVLNEAVKEVAGALCNTPATCRKYYIHPLLLDEFMEGDLGEIVRRRRERRKWSGLRKDERNLLKVLYEFEERGGK